jgi:hypothetical protein
MWKTEKKSKTLKLQIERKNGSSNFEQKKFQKNFILFFLSSVFEIAINLVQKIYILK